MGPSGAIHAHESISKKRQRSKEVHPAQTLLVLLAHGAAFHVAVDLFPFIPGQRAGLEGNGQGVQLETWHEIGRFFRQRGVAGIGQAPFCLAKEHVYGRRFLAQDRAGLFGRATVLQAKQQHVVLISRQGRGDYPEPIQGLLPFSRRVGRTSGWMLDGQRLPGDVLILKFSRVRCPLLTLRPAPDINQGVPGDAPHPTHKVDVAVILSQRAVSLDESHLDCILSGLDVAGVLQQIVSDWLKVEPEQFVEGRFVTTAKASNQVVVAVGGRGRYGAGSVGRGFSWHAVIDLSSRVK